MFHRTSPIFVVLLFLGDLAIACGAWIAAYWLRFDSGWVDLPPGPGGEPVAAPLGLYLEALPLVLMTVVVTYRLLGLYEPRRTGTIGDEVRAILVANVLVLLAVAALAQYYRRTEYSRVLLALFPALNATGTGALRALGRLALRALRIRGHNMRRALIVGDGKVGQKLARALAENPWTGIAVAGFVGHDPARGPRTIDGVPVVGSIDGIGAAVESLGVDQIYVALPWNQTGALSRVVDQLAEHSVDLRVVPDLRGFTLLNPRAEDFCGLPLISMRASPLDGWGGFAKRAIDVVASVAFIALAALPMIAIAIAVKAGSRGPVLFRQERVGLDGRRFMMLKFRSMREDAEQATGAVMASRDDPRRTRVGAFLRRTSLDELPQFLNVLKGEMSIVGPRPERPELIERFKKRYPRYMLRHKMKAGITGWAQINGLRGVETSLRKRIRYDLYYIEHWSVWFDLQIMLQTVFHVAQGENAY